MGLDVGDLAPEFTLKDSKENYVSLSDFKGKWIVLYFYPKDNTPGCTKEACDFTSILSEFSEVGAIVIGVSPDSPSSHKNFIKKHNLKIILLSDPDKAVLKLYGAWGKKKNYGREYEGVIRSTFLINPDGRVAFIWRNVRVRTKRKGQEITHAQIVKEKLKVFLGD